MNCWEVLRTLNPSISRPSPRGPETREPLFWALRWAIYLKKVLMLLLLLGLASYPHAASATNLNHACSERSFRKGNQSLIPTTNTKEVLKIFIFHSGLISSRKSMFFSWPSKSWYSCNYTCRHLIQFGGRLCPNNAPTMFLDACQFLILCEKVLGFKDGERIYHEPASGFRKVDFGGSIGQKTARTNVVSPYLSRWGFSASVSDSASRS